MARATATWTDTETTDWAVTQKVREGKFRLQVLQNIEYVLDQVNNLTTNEYWALYEQRLQSGLVPGGPFA